MIRSLTWMLALLVPSFACAQMSPDSPMVQALREGRATAPLPESQGAQLVAEKIKERTGSTGDVTVEFVRIARFASQAHCGRVGYGLYQKASNTFWGQFGGQMNMCDDGTPPRRQCAGTTGLVAPDAKCQDGAMPTDTPEVKAAVAKAVAGGSVTAEQFKAQYAVQRKEGKDRP